MSPIVHASEIRFATPIDAGVGVATRQFEAIADGHFRWTLIEPGIQLEISRLRRERHELCGELIVRCDLAGTRTIGGALSTGTFNLSSIGARKTLARHLDERARVKDVDWFLLLEEFCQHVHDADRRGQPADVLRDVPRLAPGEQDYDIDGLRFPRHHPTIGFGDAGTTKSLVLLWVLGRLAQAGVQTALFDWELDKYAHRDRLERLFGVDMPNVLYARCDKPVGYEADRLARIVRDEQVLFAGFDSIGFACAGRPEEAEAALEYFRAVRQLGIGTLHVAHIRQGENNDQRPFGSTFWHGSARCTWNFKVSATSADGGRVHLGLFNRKNNFGAPLPAVGFQLDFDRDRTHVQRVNLADVEELQESLPIWQRMTHALRHGPKTLHALAEELGEKSDSLDRAIRRRPKQFTREAGPDGVGRIVLAERRVS